MSPESFPASFAPSLSFSGFASIISTNRSNPVTPFWYCSMKLISVMTGVTNMPIDTMNVE